MYNSSFSFYNPRIQSSKKFQAYPASSFNPKLILVDGNDLLRK